MSLSLKELIHCLKATKFVAATDRADRYFEIKMTENGPKVVIKSKNGKTFKLDETIVGTSRPWDDQQWYDGVAHVLTVFMLPEYSASEAVKWEKYYTNELKRQFNKKTPFGRTVVFRFNKEAEVTKP